MTPLLLAESDRDIYRREQAALAREKEIMKDVPDWEVSSFLLLLLSLSNRFQTETKMLNFPQNPKTNRLERVLTTLNVTLPTLSSSSSSNYTFLFAFLSSLFVYLLCLFFLRKKNQHLSVVLNCQLDPLDSGFGERRMILFHARFTVVKISLITISNPRISS